MRDRQPFAYVVSIDGSRVTLNLQDSHKGHHAAHPEGVSAVTEVGGLCGVDGGGRLLVLRVRKLEFAEPRDAHRAGVGSTAVRAEPLRQVEAAVFGVISRHERDGLEFESTSLASPSLGAEAYPLTRQELATVFRRENARGSESLRLGTEVQGGMAVRVPIQDLLSRHVAVLGSTGQGKTCFTAAMLQQLRKLKKARIVVFDINGEYEESLPEQAGSESDIKVTILGQAPGDGRDQSTRTRAQRGGAGRARESRWYRIPYVALGRHGLQRLLLPSEKTQVPALRFALESLDRVQWCEDGVGPVPVGNSTSKAVLFDDGRSESASDAKKFIERLRGKSGQSAEEAKKWPPMKALACLVADSHCLQPKMGRGVVRDAFAFGNVAPLVTRIHRCVDDPQFRSVVDVEEQNPTSRDRGGGLDWQSETTSLVKEIFGSKRSKWKIHIVNLRLVAQDLLPLILGALLESLAYERFRQGQDAADPTLLVLEEAHHYLQQPETSDGAAQQLAYARLAKEGRKFGLSLWVSTQRPAEVSSTVLAQCGTWVVFRLTSEQDRRQVGAASEWADRRELEWVAGLPRREAVAFGSGVAAPVRLKAPTASPLPKSLDPDFRKWFKEGQSGPEGGGSRKDGQPTAVASQRNPFAGCADPPF